MNIMGDIIPGNYAQVYFPNSGIKLNEQFYFFYIRKIIMKEIKERESNSYSSTSLWELIQNIVTDQ